jgi:hypothetical protein
MKLEILKEHKKEFLEFLKLISNNIIETNIKFDEKGLYIKSFDQSNVCYINLFIPLNFFSQFELKNKEEIIYINLLDFIKIIDKGCNTEYSLILSKEQDDNVMTIQNGKKKFKLCLLEPEENQKRELADFNYDVSFDMKYKDYKELISDCLIVGSKITFEIKNEKDKLKILNCYAGEQNKFITDFNENDIIISNSKNLNIKCNYNLEYLNKFISSIDFEIIHLNIDNDKPLTIFLNYKNIILKIILANLEE